MQKKEINRENSWLIYAGKKKNNSEFHHWHPQEQKLSPREYVGRNQRKALVHSEMFHQPNTSFLLIAI